MDTINTTDQVMQDNTQVIAEKSKLEKVAFIVYLITIFLTPLVFVSSNYAPLDMTKTVVVTIGILISSILYFISAFKKKSFAIPKHPLTIVGLGITISIIISTFMSTNFSKSLFGQGFEVGTASFLLVLILGSLLTVYFSNKDKDRVLYIFGAIISSFILLALFHIIRLFGGPDTLSFDVFKLTTSTLIGKWTDLALLSTIIALISYLSLQFMTVTKSVKSLLIALIALSAFFLFIVDLSFVWWTIAIVMAFLFFYQYSSTKSDIKGFSGVLKRLPIATSIIFVVVLLLALPRNEKTINPIVKSLNLIPTEVVLPWQHTLDIASETIKLNPIFGAGPNRFGVQYLNFKPLSINPTQFWNTEFSNGSGLVPTFMVTQGILGSGLWLLFIALFAFSGYKILRKTTDNLSKFLISSSFFSALFLWLICLVYVPSHSILLITAILTGLFVGTLASDGYVSFKKLGKINTLAVTVLVIICLVWISVYTKKTIALGYFQGGINALDLPNNEGLDKAETNFKNALKYDESDIYYQALSEINILKITALAQQIQSQAQQGSKTPDAESVKKISALIDEAVQYTVKAARIDPTNYYNYVAEARISEVALSLKVPNAYDNAKVAYSNAIKYNPFNPSLYLNLARIEASQNKLAEAQKYIGSALQLKQNYSEAIFLLSQIQVSQGQIKDAITSVQVASQINPTNPLVFFQLGLLYYNDKDYQNAVTSLSKAIELNNQYANARYFLGLSYARLGKTAEAVAQFENIAQTNPDNQEVMLILANLKAGKSPFSDAQPPVDSKPEKRKTLPVKEKATDSTKSKTI